MGDRRESNPRRLGHSQSPENHSGTVTMSTAQVPCEPSVEVVVLVAFRLLFFFLVLVEDLLVDDHADDDHRDDGGDLELVFHDFTFTLV